MTAPQDPRGRPLRTEGAPWVVLFRHGVETPVASAAPVPTSAPAPRGRRCGTRPPFRRFPVPRGAPCGGPDTHTTAAGQLLVASPSPKGEQALGQGGLPLSEGPWDRHGGNTVYFVFIRPAPPLPTAPHYPPPLPLPPPRTTHYPLAPLAPPQTAPPFTPHYPLSPPPPYPYPYPPTHKPLAPAPFATRYPQSRLYHRAGPPVRRRGLLHSPPHHLQSIQCSPCPPPPRPAVVVILF